MARISILAGKLLRSVDAAPLSGPASMYVATTALQVQLFDPDTGKEITGSYRGEGTIVTRDDGRTYVVMGDPLSQANLQEAVMADGPTKESLADFDAFRAGFTAGVEGKRKKRNADPVGPWMCGYEDGKKAASMGHES